MSQEVELKSVSVVSDTKATPVEEKRESPIVIAPAAPESGKDRPAPAAARPSASVGSLMPLVVWLWDSSVL